jgi:hypothetical protein
VQSSKFKVKRGKREERRQFWILDSEFWIERRRGRGKLKVKSAKLKVKRGKRLWIVDSDFWILTSEICIER